VKIVTPNFDLVFPDAGVESRRCEARNRADRAEIDEVTLNLFATWRLGVIIVFKPIDDSRDAVFDRRHVKVD